MILRMAYVFFARCLSFPLSPPVQRYRERAIYESGFSDIYIFNKHIKSLSKIRVIISIYIKNRIYSSFLKIIAFFS